MPTELATIKEAQVDPMHMIQRAFESAIANGTGLEVVDRILAQQREMMHYNDELAFNNALRRIQNQLKPIVKRGDNPSTRSKYATMDAIDDELESLLQQEGMALSFSPEPCDKSDMVRVVGVLSLGAYSRRYPLDMPADGQGAKGGGVMTRTHATGSGISYGIRYLKRMIFNLRFKDADDDGNAAGANAQLQRMTEGAQQEWIDHIKASATVTELQTRYLDALRAADTAGDLVSTKQFAAAQNQCFNRLKAKREGK